MRFDGQCGWNSETGRFSPRAFQTASTWCRFVEYGSRCTVGVQYFIMYCVSSFFPVMCMVGYLGQVEPVCRVRLLTTTHCCIHFVFVFRFLFFFILCVVSLATRGCARTGGRRRKRAKVTAQDLVLFRDSHGRF